LQIITDKDIAFTSENSMITVRQKELNILLPRVYPELMAR